MFGSSQKIELLGESEFYEKLARDVDTVVTGRLQKDSDEDYLRNLAPNIVEWVTGVDYWNVPSTFQYWRQYQVLRDLFNLRCPICNSQNPADIDCWNKSRLSLEAETLLVWDDGAFDFVCPKCRNTQRDFFDDGLMVPYNETIILAGMRSGKSYLGAHIGGYIEHVNSALAVRGKHTLQRLLQQERSEWFEVTFAASTAEQAENTIYAKYREMRNNSPWMNRYVNWVQNQEKKQISGGRDLWKYKQLEAVVEDGWAQVRYNRIASESGGVAGRTRMLASIDEWARLIDSMSTRSALELYRVLNQSLKTVRGAQRENSLPRFWGWMINVTSPLSQDDPAMQTYRKAREGRLKRAYSWKGATWEFNPKLPRAEFDDEYDRDPVGAERDFGANPPNAETPFVNDPLRYWRSIDWDREPLATFDYRRFEDVTGRKYMAADLDFCKLDSNNKYYIFIDAGVSWDAFGLVIAHPEWRDATGNESDFERDMKKKGYVRRGGFYTGGTQPTGIPIRNHDKSLITVYDAVMRIVPDASHEIWFESIVKIVGDLKKRIKIAALVADHWGSDSTIQQIRTMGINAYKHALKTDHFMYYLQNSYNGRTIHLPPLPEDLINISETGQLELGRNQEEMAPQSVALVEVLKLTRSEDLRKIYNPNKGKMRGRDSDDLARCIIGAHFIVHDSVYDRTADQKGKREKKKRQAALSSGGTVARGRTW